MKSWWLHWKQIKTNNETKFPINSILNNEIEKKILIKKDLKMTQVNLK
jgi:hypothetical protein